MTKKQTITAASSSRPTEPAATSSFQFNKNGIIPLLAVLLYLGVHFIPDFEAYDAMGPQWFYLVCVDLLVSLYLLARKDQYTEAASALSQHLFSWLYLAFFVLAGVSVLASINPTEGLVNYVRLTATIVAFFNLGILFYQRTDLFRSIALLISLVLLVETLQSISFFLKNTGTLTMVELIKEIKGQAGNKNIYVAGIVVKIPFAIYFIHSSRLLMRLLHILILALAALTIFLLNSRASYLTLILILVLYLVYSFLEARKQKQSERTLFQAAYVLLPVLASLFISQLLLENLKSYEKESDTQQLFGTVTERLGSISTLSDESNMVRLRLWKHAFDYTIHHPFIGCGYGNWKIASIPYQRIITKDLYVPIHAHNDFIEAFAETGIAGGLLYLSLFLCITLCTFRTFRSEAKQEIKLISIFSFLAFVGYSSDAFFNFPMERPLNQMFFALFAAINVMAHMAMQTETKKEEQEKPLRNSLPIALYGLVAILLLIPAAYVTYQTHRSLKIQRSVLADLNNEPLKLDWKIIVPSFPSIPNLSATAQPIDAIKGRYLYEAEQFDEALVLLNKGRKANPVIGYSEFLKAGLFFKTNRLDSAYSNALFAFYTRPKAKTYYQTLIAVLAKLKDTTEIKKAFAEYDRYRHEPIGWDLYLRGMLNAQGKGSRYLLSMADSALKMFAKEEGVANIATVRDEIIRFMENPSANGSATINSADLAAAARYYNDAVAAFGTGVAGKDNLEKAASLFLKAAALNPGNYVAYENAAICYFNTKQWQKSITYFNKVLATKLSTNGKPEYFKGVALYNLGQREEGCNNLKVSMSKGWKEAEAVVKANCK
jgi:O-antigen ligase